MSHAITVSPPSIHAPRCVQLSQSCPRISNTLAGSRYSKLRTGASTARASPALIPAGIVGKISAACARARLLALAARLRRFGELAAQRAFVLRQHLSAHASPRAVLVRTAQPKTGNRARPGLCRPALPASGYAGTRCSARGCGTRGVDSPASHSGIACSFSRLHFDHQVERVPRLAQILDAVFRAPSADVGDHVPL